MDWTEIEEKWVAHKDSILYFVSQVGPYWSIWIDREVSELERLNQHFMTRQEAMDHAEALYV